MNLLLAEWYVFYFVSSASIKPLFKVFFVLCYQLANWRECCAAEPAFRVGSTLKFQGWERSCSKSEVVFEEEL